ncbi:hypothetical protein K445DRAFT_43163, partial [Daldinia sp. EC12]
MAALTIPDAGLLLESSANSSDYLPLQAFGITLNDSVIEDMIKCVQGGQEVELTLGSNPSLTFGSGEQKVTTNPQSYDYDLYLTKPEDSASKAQRLPNPTMCILSKPPASILASRSTNNKVKETKRVTKPKPLPAGRSAMAGALSTSSTRSLPTSPALNGVSSPNPAFSASQQLLEKNKNQRSILVHELASRDRTYEYLSEIWKGAEADLKRNVEKIANFDSSTKKYSLRPVFWKELDVWNYDYRSEEDRRAAIDNAIRQYDKSRLPTSAVEWEKLLTPSERGKGIVLSKLQATLAKGNVTPTPRVGMKKSEDGNKSDADNKAKGEAMARSNSQPLGSKTKKVSEREAQTKRLFSSNPKKPAPKKPVSRAKPAEEKGRKFLSDEKVIDSESSGDERPLSRASSNQSAPKPPAPPKAKPVVRAPRPPVKPTSVTSQKRAREDDDSSSSSGAPLSKRIKPKEPPKPLSNVTNLKHRPSDASQSSRNAPVGGTSSNISMRSKNTSPTKSSPLASSPPTNASDLEDHQPPARQAKPLTKKRKEREADQYSSQQTAPNKKPRVPPDVLIKAKKFTRFYERYEALHYEIAALKEPPEDKLADLIDMRERLSIMKSEI